MMVTRMIYPKFWHDLGWLVGYLAFFGYNIEYLDIGISPSPTSTILVADLTYSLSERCQISTSHKPNLPTETYTYTIPNLIIVTT